MYIKLPVKENKQILSDNLDLLSINVKSVEGIVPSRSIDKFNKRIGLLSLKLKGVNNKTAFAKIFLDYFILLQDFHSMIVRCKCEDIVEQAYRGYKLLEPM